MQREEDIHGGSTTAHATVAMRALISGAGIAGLTAAALLRRAHYDVVVVEQSPAPRDAGYMIEFFGPGYDVAEEMSLLTILESIHHPIPRIDFLDARGRTTVSLDYASVRRRIFGDRHFNILCEDLGRVLRRRASGNGAEIRFGTTILALSECGDSVHAWLSDGTTEMFDVVVGADGVRSNVRALAFGPMVVFTRSLGYDAAACTLEDSELAAEVAGRFATLSAPGRQVAVYPIQGNRVATFFLHRTTLPPLDHSAAAVCNTLESVYGDLDGLVSRAVGGCSAGACPHYDTVVQIDVAPWRAGRVVLVGDAGYAASPLGGQGASLAMAGAAALARALRANGNDVPKALMMYDRQFRPIVARRRKVGRRLARWLLPDSRIELRMRDAALRVSTWPFVFPLLRRSME